MLNNPHKEWLAKYSDIQESFGIKAKYPLTSIKHHISYEFDKRNKHSKYLADNISQSFSENVSQFSEDIIGSLENGFANLNIQIAISTEKLNNSLIAIKDEVEDVKFSIDNLTNVVEEGFYQTNRSLEMINSTLDRNFSLLIEQSIITNELLNDIIEVLQIPEFEKEKIYFIKKGLKFFSSSKENNEFYNDALEYLLKAKEKDGEKDYFLLQKIGLIYVYSEKHRDYNEAIKYFDLSAHYGSPEIKNTKYSFGYKHSDLSNFTHPTVITSNSYKHSAFCHYQIKQKKQALEQIKKAYLTNPNDLDILYDLCKYFAINNKLNDAIGNLKVLIESDYNYLIRISQDIDFLIHKAIKDFFTTYKQDLRTKYEKVYSQLTEETKKIKTFSKPILNISHTIFKKGSLIDTFFAFELLNKPKKLIYYLELFYKKEFVKIENGLTKINSILEEIGKEFSVKELIKYEINSINSFTEYVNAINIKLENKLFLSEYDKIKKISTGKDLLHSIYGFKYIDIDNKYDVINIFWDKKIKSFDIRDYPNIMSFRNYYTFQKKYKKEIIHFYEYKNLVTDSKKLLSEQERINVKINKYKRTSPIPGFALLFIFITFINIFNSKNHPSGWATISFSQIISYLFIFIVIGSSFFISIPLITGYYFGKNNGKKINKILDVLEQELRRIDFDIFMIQNQIKEKYDILVKLEKPNLIINKY